MSDHNAETGDILPITESPADPFATANTPQYSTPLRYTIGVLLLLAGGLGLAILLPILPTLLITFIFAFLLYLPVRALTLSSPLSYNASLFTVYLLLIAIIVGILLLIIPNLVVQVNQIVADLRSANGELLEQLDALETDGEADGPVVDALQIALQGEADRQPADEGEAEAFLESPTLYTIITQIGVLLRWFVSNGFSLLGSVVGLLGQLVIALFLSFLILLDLKGSSGIMGQWIPKRFDREVRLTLQELDEVWLGFVRGQLLVGVILSLGSFVLFTLQGVQGALPLALIQGFIGLIPTIGGIIALIPTAASTLLLGSTRFTEMSPLAFTLLVIGVNAIFSQVVYSLISPVIMGKSVRLPTIVVFVGVIIGLSVGGILGALIVVPLLSTIRVLASYFISKVVRVEPYPGVEPDPQANGFFNQLYTGVRNLEKSLRRSR